jgi:hypothetical protein
MPLPEVKIPSHTEAFADLSDLMRDLATFDSMADFASWQVGARCHPTDPDHLTSKSLVEADISDMSIIGQSERKKLL